MKEGIQILIVVVALIGFSAAWFYWYVLPRDQLMKDTQNCVDEQIEGVSDDRWRYQAEKKAWKGCWSSLSKDQDWVWSDASRPRKQGEP